MIVELEFQIYYSLAFKYRGCRFAILQTPKNNGDISIRWASVFFPSFSFSFILSKIFRKIYCIKNDAFRGEDTQIRESIGKLTDAFYDYITLRETLWNFINAVIRLGYSTGYSMELFKFHKINY